MRPIPVTLSSDNGRASAGSLAKLKNIYVEKVLQSQEKYALLSTPGMKKVFETTDEGPIVAGLETPDSAYFCTRKAIYQVVGTRYIKRANINLAGKASMAHNGQSMVIVDGYKSYSFSFFDNRVTELDIPRSHNVVFSDGYFIINYINNNQFAVSDLYSTTFNPLNFASAEGSPDDIQGLAVYKRQIYIPGQKSTEIWYNSGEDFPFSPNLSAYMDIGCLTPWSFASNVDGVFWLGDDKIVYMAPGYTPQRISTSAIEYHLSQIDCSDAQMLSYSSEGHDFIVLCLKKANRMFCYDITYDSWHERESPLGVYECMFSVGSDTFVGMGDGNLYKFDKNLGTDDGQIVQRECITPTIDGEGNRFRISSVELSVQYFYQGSPDKLLIDMTDEERLINVDKGFVAMSYTDDDGATWSDEALAFPSGPGGKFRWHKCGMSYRRAFKFRYAGVKPMVWMGVSIG